MICGVQRLLADLEARGLELLRSAQPRRAAVGEIVPVSVLVVIHGHRLPALVGLRFLPLVGDITHREMKMSSVWSTLPKLANYAIRE